MRGDAALTLRLLLRRTGVAGVAIAAGGSLATIGSLRSWHRVVAEVSLLGSSGDRTVASLRGVPHTLGGSVALLLGVLVLALGVAVALDRTPPRGRFLAGGAAALLGLVAILALLSTPPAVEVSGPTSRDLTRMRDRLPVGVELELHTSPGAGPWWVLGGAALAVVGAVNARER